MRAWQPGDAEKLVQAWSDDEVARWNPVPPQPTLDRASHWINGFDLRCERGLSLDLCVVTDEHPSVVGEVGVSSIDRDRRAALIGYWLLPEARGRGLASLATAALTDWLLKDVGFALLVARCASANLASQRVAHRAGYQHAGSDDSGHELYVRRSTQDP